MLYFFVILLVSGRININIAIRIQLLLCNQKSSLFLKRILKIFWFFLLILGVSLEKLLISIKRGLRLDI